MLKNISNFIIDVAEYIQSMFANYAIYVSYKVEIEAGDIAGFPKLNANLIPCVINYNIAWDYKKTPNSYAVIIKSTKDYLIDKANSLALIRYANIWGKPNDECYSTIQQERLEKHSESIKLKCLKEYVDDYTREGYSVSFVRKL